MNNHPGQYSEQRHSRQQRRAYSTQPGEVRSSRGEAGTSAGHRTAREGTPRADVRRTGASTGAAQRNAAHRSSAADNATRHNGSHRSSATANASQHGGSRRTSAAANAAHHSNSRSTHQRETYVRSSSRMAHVDQSVGGSRSAYERGGQRGGRGSGSLGPASGGFGGGMVGRAGALAGNGNAKGLIIRVALVVLAVLLALFLFNKITSCGANNAEEEVPENLQEQKISFAPQVSAIDTVSDPGKTVTGFTVAGSDGYVPAISSDAQQQIQQAAETLAGTKQEVGFAMVDMQSGSGLAYNLDERVFGASSFKAHVFIYGCQNAIDTGNVSIAGVKGLCEDTILYSSNTSYLQLRRKFEATSTRTLANWLESLSIDGSVAEDGGLPNYSARESLKLWMNAYLYLNSQDSNQETTAWAKSLLSNTNVSMVRNGVDPSTLAVSEERCKAVADEMTGILMPGMHANALGTAKATKVSNSGITVYNKAGWIAGDTKHALCDGGIIDDNGHYYLLTIMSSAYDSGSARKALTNLASTLWAQREALSPQ